MLGFPVARIAEQHELSTDASHTFSVRMLISVGIFAQASETELSKFCSNKSDSFFPSASKLACLHETRLPLDATRCFHDSTEQLEEHVQDMHQCRRTFLFAPYALVRSNSMWKQRGRHQPQHSSPNVWCRLHCETATEHLATLLFDSNSPIRQSATEHRPNGATLCEDCDEAYHNVLCPATGHAHIVHATGVGSVLPFG